MTTNNDNDPAEVRAESVDDLTDGQLLQLFRFLGREPKLTVKPDETPDRPSLPERPR